MNSYSQIAIVVFSGICSWAIAGWVTVNVMKYQMTQFFMEIKELKEWRLVFQQTYNDHRVEYARELERLHGKFPKV